jgi:hypothetical protein
MVLQKFKEKASNWIHSVRHFSDIGKTATKRAFLSRERKKLLMKFGEKTLHWLNGEKGVPPELHRLADQIKKIDKLLSDHDYGKGKAPLKKPI